MEKLKTILDGIGIPCAYHHFAEGEAPEPPFICYLLPSSDNFSADGKVYHRVAVVNVELYTDAKSPEVEAAIESALDSAEIFWNKSETWIESERLYEVVYEFEMEVA